MNKRAMAVVIGALVVVAGCGSSSSGDNNSGSIAPIKTPKPHTHTPKPSTPTPTPTATVTSSATATATATATGTTEPVAVPRCLSSHLSLSLGQGQGAAGTTYTPIVLTNTGSTTCELHGYPGVSFVTSSGHLIGKPASEDVGNSKEIKIHSGGKANALLRQPNPGNFEASQCDQTTADRLRVYPPGETVPLFVNDPAPICSTSAGRTGVRPMAAGDGS